MDNTPDNKLFNARINVIPFTEMPELEAMFSLMDESYPKFLALSLECFTSFSAPLFTLGATTITWTSAA